MSTARWKWPCGSSSLWIWAPRSPGGSWCWPAITSIEELNEQAGLSIDDRTCASHEENAPYDLTYAVNCYAALAEQIAKAKAQATPTESAA